MGSFSASTTSCVVTVMVLGRPLMRSRPRTSMVRLSSAAQHGGAHLHLDVLRGAVADEEVLLVADVADDGLVELVAGYAHALGHDDATE